MASVLFVCLLFVAGNRLRLNEITSGERILVPKVSGSSKEAVGIGFLSVNKTMLSPPRCPGNPPE